MKDSIFHWVDNTADFFHRIRLLDYEKGKNYITIEKHGFAFISVTILPFGIFRNTFGQLMKNPVITTFYNCFIYESVFIYNNYNLFLA